MNSCEVFDRVARGEITAEQGARLLAEHDGPKPLRAMAKAKAFGVLVLVVAALALLCSPAHADVLVLGPPPDAGCRTLFDGCNTSICCGQTCTTTAMYCTTPTIVSIQAQPPVGSPIGDPCAPGYDADAGVPLRTAALPDGGVEDVPSAICKDQRAPAHGVFLTTRQAAAMAGERAGLHAENKSLQDAVKAQPAIPPKAWFLGCILGTAVTVYCALHDCNPLHLGRK